MAAAQSQQLFGMHLVEGLASDRSDGVAAFRKVATQSATLSAGDQNHGDAGTLQCDRAQSLECDIGLVDLKWGSLGGGKVGQLCRLEPFGIKRFQFEEIKPRKGLDQIVAVGVVQCVPVGE